LRWPLAGVSTLALALAGVGFVLADWQPVGHGLGWLLLAAVGAWIPPAWFVASAVRKENVASAAWRERLPIWTALKRSCPDMSPKPFNIGH
jgi:hypothetical protein